MSQRILKTLLLACAAAVCFFIARQTALAIKNIHSWPSTVAQISTSYLATDYLALRKEPCKILKIKYTYQIADKTYSDNESFYECLHRNKKHNRDGNYPVDPNFDKKINFYAQGNNIQIIYDPNYPSYNIVDSDKFLKNAPARTFLTFLIGGILTFFAVLVIFV